MASFKDKNGRSWTIEFDGPTFERINEVIGIDVSEESGRGLLQACAIPQRIVKLCWMIVEEDARAANVTEKMFLKATNDGAIIESMEGALREALVNFTRPKMRLALSAVFRSQDDVAGETLKQMQETMDDPVNRAIAVNAVTSEMKKALERMKIQASSSGSSATVSPDTADETPQG